MSKYMTKKIHFDPLGSRNAHIVVKHIPALQLKAAFYNSKPREGGGAVEPTPQHIHHPIQM
ncbi:unnamed protein product, partial [Brassica oleracea var. botrytis]